MTCRRLVGFGGALLFVFTSMALSQDATAVFAQNKPTDRAAVAEEPPADDAVAGQNKPMDRASVATDARAANERKRPLGAAQMVTALERVLEQVKALPSATATDVRAVEQALEAARNDRFLDARRRQ